VGKLNPCWKKEDNTTILLVFGVGISSPFIGHHRSIPGEEGNDSGLAFGFRSHLQWIFGTFQTGSDHGARGKNPK
jgi:hypothetical protein